MKSESLSETKFYQGRFELGQRRFKGGISNPSQVHRKAENFQVIRNQ